MIDIPNYYICWLKTCVIVDDVLIPVAFYEISN